MGSLFGSSTLPAAGGDATSSVVRNKLNWLYEVLANLLINAADDSAGCSLRDNIGRRPGQVIINAHAATEPGCLPCDGAQVSRATYAALFAKIGTTWGIGDGYSTFNVPFFDGRTLVMSGTGAGLTTRVVGQLFGEEKHTQTIEEMPSHHHSFALITYDDGGGVMPHHTGTGVNTSDTGGGQPFNVCQPSAVVRAWIKY